MSSGKASRELLQELHRLLIETLHQKLTNKKTKAGRVHGVDLLSEVGALLRWEGVRADGVRRHRQLVSLHVAYMAALTRALEEDRPSAGVMGEARAALRAEGVRLTEGPTEEVKPVKSSTALPGLGLPFKAPDKPH